MQHLTPAQIKSLRTAAEVYAKHYPNAYWSSLRESNKSQAALHLIHHATISPLLNAGLIDYVPHVIANRFIITQAGQEWLKEYNAVSLDDPPMQESELEPEDEMDFLVAQLASWRTAADIAKKEYDTALKANPNLAALAARKEEAKQKVAHFDAVLREAALAQFAHNPEERQVHPKVTIKMATQLAYDAADAERHARRFGIYLIFDRKSFDSDMKKIKALPDFVKRYEEPKVYIARKLRED